MRWTVPELLQTTSAELEPAEQSDAFSFDMVLWELIAREAPHESIDENDDCVVVPQGLRPQVPPLCSPALVALVGRDRRRPPRAPRSC